MEKESLGATMNFRQHCRSRGIEINRDDLKLIKSSLEKLPYHLKRQAVQDYLEEWEAGMSETDKSFRRQNLGRYRANSYLIRKVEQNEKNN